MRPVGAVAVNLRLLQISDSALPIGGYTHSWGLEAAIAAGDVRQPADLENWTRRWLRASLAPLEGVLAASACRAAIAGDAPAAAELNSIADVSIVPPSVRNASREMGDQLLALGRTWEWSAESLSRLLTEQDAARRWHHAVAFGLLGAIAGCEPIEALAAYFHQAALGMISAGVRAIPLGHTHGQQILAYLQDDIGELAAAYCDISADQAGAGSPYYEVLCDAQTHLYARMFRS